MKTLQIRITLTFLAMLFAFSAVAQTAQQSAIYDAIAIMNANHSINVIMIPDAIGYYTIDPITGERGNGGQTTALDASLKKSNNSTDIIKKILKRNANLKDDATDLELQSAYSNNPFLKSLVLPTPVAFNAAKLGDNLAPFITNPSSGISGTTFMKNVANGTADFLIKRANEEISVAVIQRLKTFTAHYPEFSVLFPRTINLIKPVAAYDYAKTLNALKSALKEDLDQLPANLPQLYSIPRYKAINDRAPVITMIFTASEMLNALHGKKSLGQSLHSLDTCKFLSAENNYASFVRVVTLTSDNLRKKSLTDSADDDLDYISTDEINKITNNQDANKAELALYFLGLLYQRGNKIPFWTGTQKKTAVDLLSAWASSSNTDFAKLLNKIAETSGKLQELKVELIKIKEYDQGINQLSWRPFSADRYNTYNQLIIKSLQLCEPFVTGSDSATPFKKEFARITTYWPNFSGHTINMIKALGEKEYSLAVDDLSQMLNVVSSYMDEMKKDDTFKKQTADEAKNNATNEINAIDAKITTINSELNKISQLTPVTPQDKTAYYDQQQGLLREKTILAAKLKESKWQEENSEKFIFTLSKVTEYYKLFASLSQAESGKEVEALLESYALPSGSSRIKKVTNFNIAINAFVGGFFARTKTVGAGFSNEYGLTAPIGFTISHGFNKVGSLSLFLGVFDIGGIIRYKLDNDGAYQQDVNLAGLVSPSVHLAYGFPFYLPLSFGAGYQWTSPVSTSSNNFNLKPHFNLFLAVDIPMFNLTASRKKYKND